MDVRKGVQVSTASRQFSAQRWRIFTAQRIRLDIRGKQKLESSPRSASVEIETEFRLVSVLGFQPIN